MRNMRMPKGWVLIGTNAMGFGSNETKQERIRKEQKFRQAIKNINSEKIEELKKESENLFEAKINTNTALLQAFEDKKLKSKSLIKKAKVLKKKKEKEAAKKAAEAKSAKVATA